MLSPETLNRITGLAEQLAVAESLGLKVGTISAQVAIGFDSPTQANLLAYFGKRTATGGLSVDWEAEGGIAVVA